MKELVIKAEPSQYDADPEDPLSRMVLKKIRAKYEMTTFITFANNLSDGMQTAVDMYSHSIIVIDEVQQLVGARGGNDPYSLIKLFLHSVKDSKILLMSGTPMKDTPDQFAMVMNLIIDEDKQLPTGAAFISEYFKDLYLTEPGKLRLKDLLRNKISYLSPPSSVPIKFMGEQMKGSKVKFLRIVEDEMSKFQSKNYGKVIEMDSLVPGTDFDRPDRYASDFIFPDGTFGTAGIISGKFVEKSGDSLRLTKKF
jgi:hypothetical protein